MPRPSAFASMLLLASGLAHAGGDPPIHAAECAVWARELSFADSVARHDAAAFAAHVDPDAVFDAGGARPVRGRAAVVSAWSDIVAGKGVALVWYPTRTTAGTGAAATVAWSTGPYLMIATDAKGEVHRTTGTFRSVWRRDGHGRWRVLYDAGGNDRRAATADDVAAFEAGRRATCPPD